MPRFEKDAQLTLEGVTVTEQDWIMSLQSVSNMQVRCPFCLAEQTLRSMCFALNNGVLSHMRRCSFCKKEMLERSATKFLQGEIAYAEWVADYASKGKFWFIIDRDNWFRMVQLLTEQKKFKPWDFWKRYREIKPKRETYEEKHEKEEQEIDDAYASYVKSGQRDEAKAPVYTSFTFKDKTGTLMGPYVLQGLALEEDGTNYYVKMSTAKVPVKKAAWDLVVKDEEVKR